MSNISYLVAGVATGERNRARVRRTGVTPKGDLVWTAEEESILRQHHRDYQAAVRALGGRRSYYAVRAKTQALGLAPKRSHWTGDQVLRLRRVFRTGTTAEIREAFPDRTENNIRKMAAYFNIRRPRKPFAPTGFRIIDQIRDKCFECALSMRDLDAMAGTGRYFTRADWHQGGINLRKVGKAVKALGGELTVRWDDQPDNLPQVLPMPKLMPAGRLTAPRVVHIAA